MLYFEQGRKGLTYLMAAAMTAAPAFHIGDTIEIQTLLNARNDKNFLSDKNSISKYVVTQLPKGTLGEIEDVHQFKPKKGAKQGNTGVKIKVTSGSKQGEYWVLYRPDRDYLKLYDKQAKETASIDEAKNVETRRELGAIQDRKPAEDSQPKTSPEAQEVNDSDAAQGAIDLSQYIKDAGAAPQIDCQTDAPKQDEPAPLPELELPKLEVPKLPPLPDDVAIKYLRDTPRVQSADPQIQGLASSITQGKTNEFEKAMAVHDWVATNVNYDTVSYGNKKFNNIDYTRKYDALEVLNSGEPRTAICSGYSNLTVALLRASGIPARVREGLLHYDGPPANPTCDGAKDQPNYHAWVEAWVNGDWLPMDVTGDAGYYDPKTNIFTSHPSNRFMDPTVFDNTHTKCDVNDYY